MIRTAAAALLFLATSACVEPTTHSRPELSVEEWLPSTPTAPPPPLVPPSSGVALQDSEDSGEAVQELPLAVPASGGRLITLSEALAITEQQSINVAVARSQVAAAQAEESIARALWLPTLEPRAGYIRHQGRIQDTDGDVFNANRQSAAYGAGLNLRMSPADAYYGQRAAAEDAGAARAGVTATTHDTKYLCAQLYFDLVEAYAATGIAERAVAHAQELYSVEQARLEGGAALRVDLLRAQARLAETERDLAATHNWVAISSASLAELLLLDQAVPLVPAHSQVHMLEMVVPSDQRQLLEQALATRPELERARSHVRGRQEEENYARKGWMIPEVELAASWSGFGYTPSDTADRQDYMAGLSWSLGASLFGEKDRAQALREEAELEERRVLHRIAAEVVQASRTVESTREQIRAAETEVEASRAAAELALIRLSQGAGLMIEVLDAQVRQTESEMALASSVARFNRAQFQLLRAIGAGELHSE